MHVGKQPPILANFCFSSSYTLSFLQSCVCWKHCKNSVLSRTQLLCITHSKAPFRGGLLNGTFETKSAIWVFPCACWNPYFCSVWCFCMVTNKWHLPKQIVSTKMRVFYLPNTNSVCLFSPKCHFNSHNHPQNIIFQFFFLRFTLTICSSFLFILRRKNDKNKECTFFVRKPFFDTPTTCKKKYFAPLRTNCDLKITQRHYKTGKQTKNIVQIFDSTLDHILAQTKANFWTNFWLYNRFGQEDEEGSAVR